MIDFNSKPLFLAPLAGFSDLPFRELVKKFNCDVTVSEMISANALVFAPEKSIHMIQKSNLENPYIVQIAGYEIENIKKAVQIINNFDEISGIDLNCGCPVPKVVKQKAGSALLNDLEKLKTIIECIKKYSNKKTTSVKFRLGFNEKIPDKIAKACEEAGADYISIHGRTRQEGYSGNADYNAIKIAKEAVNIPVIANGDINEDNFQEVLDITKCDGLMIGRASIGKPWIFTEIKTGKKIDKNLKKQIILEHFDVMFKYYGQKSLAIFRKHLHQYCKNEQNSSDFRNAINSINDHKNFRKEIDNFF